jgi:hypothetical protein
MENSRRTDRLIFQDLGGATRGEISHTDDPIRLEHPNDFAQVIVAHSEQGLAFLRRQLVRRAVAAALFQEGERAVIHNEMVAKEPLGRTETLREQSPEPSPADFRSVAIKAGDRPARMLVERATDRALDSQPSTHGGDLAERHADLRHAKGTGVHAEEEDALAAVSILTEIRFMRFPRVVERVIDVRDGR